MENQTVERAPILTKRQMAGALVVSLVVGMTALAGATPPDAASVATAAGTSFKDTALDVIVILVPLAVAVIVAKRAFAMARSWVG